MSAGHTSAWTVGHTSARTAGHTSACLWDTCQYRLWHTHQHVLWNRHLPGTADCSLNSLHFLCSAQYVCGCFHFYTLKSIIGHFKFLLVVAVVTEYFLLFSRMQLASLSFWFIFLSPPIYSGLCFLVRRWYLNVSDANSLIFILIAHCQDYFPQELLALSLLIFPFIDFIYLLENSSLPRDPDSIHFYFVKLCIL